MINLIVHADDLGISKKVNEGILQAHTNGILTSASIIANGAAFEHAVEICRSVPTLDVGVHLTLVEEQALLTSDVIATLVNSDRKFHRNAKEFAKKYFMGKIRLTEVKQELEAQVRKVLSSGIKVSHLDSHQHLHMLPRIHEITAKIAKQFEIPAIRFTREKIRLSMLKEMRLFSRLFLLSVLNRMPRLPEDLEVKQTDHFAGFLFSGILNKRNLMKVLANLPYDGTCELMCHPGFDDPHSLYSHWKYFWQDELDALLDKDLPGILQEKGILLISYRDLVAQKNIKFEFPAACSAG